MAPAGRHATAWSVLIVRAVRVVVLTAVVLARRTPLRSALASGMTTRISLYRLATEHGQLMIVSVFGSLWPAVVVLLAYRLLGEGLAGAQRFGVVVVLGQWSCCPHSLRGSVGVGLRIQRPSEGVAVAV